jgi:hypothetical protein
VYDFWTWFLNKAVELEIESDDLAQMISEIADYGASQRAVGITLGKAAGVNGNPDPF